jgi:hypothetical protein
MNLAGELLRPSPQGEPRAMPLYPYSFRFVLFLERIPMGGLHPKNLTLHLPKSMGDFSL